MRVALCQMNAGEEVDKNVLVATELIEEAAEGAADMAALPEMWAYLGRSSRHAEIAEQIPGPISQGLAKAARRHGMWVLGGSIFERHEGRVYNTSLLFDPAGDVAASYRKIHLFDVELPGQPPIRESATISGGEQIVTAETEFCRVGLSICYDLRFPELYRALAAAGAEILCVPSAFTHETGRAHWEVLLRARAIEDQAFVVAPAMWGSWGPPEGHRRCYGHSIVVDPWGRVVAEAPEEGSGVTFADLDLAETRRVRQRLPALGHRRLGPTC